MRALRLLQAQSVPHIGRGPNLECWSHRGIGMRLRSVQPAASPLGLGIVGHRGLGALQEIAATYLLLARAPLAGEESA